MLGIESVVRAGVGDEGQTEGEGNGFWLAVSDWRVWWMAVALTSQTVWMIYAKITSGKLIMLSTGSAFL